MGDGDHSESEDARADGRGSTILGLAGRWLGHIPSRGGTVGEQRGVSCSISETLVDGGQSRGVRLARRRIMNGNGVDDVGCR